MVVDCCRYVLVWGVLCGVGCACVVMRVVVCCCSLSCVVCCRRCLLSLGVACCCLMKVLFVVVCFWLALDVFRYLLRLFVVW